MAIKREDVMKLDKNLMHTLDFDDSLCLAFQNVREVMPKLLNELSLDWQLTSMTEDELDARTQRIVGMMFRRLTSVIEYYLDEEYIGVYKANYDYLESKYCEALHRTIFIETYNLREE
jgi:hypothetical protein